MILCIYNAIWMFYSGVQLHQRKSDKYQYQLVSVFAKLCFIIQITLINLKRIDWLSINWLYAFIIIWLFLLITIFLEIIFLYRLSVQTNKYFTSSNLEIKMQFGNNIIGQFWICMFLFCFAGVPSYTMVNLCVYLDNDQGQQDYLLAIILSVSYTVMYIVYTIYNKEVLIQFILNLNYFDQFNEYLNQDRHVLSFSSSRSQQKYVYSLKENSQKNNLLQYPTQMVKISSTYYLPDEYVIRRHQTEVNIISNKQATITEVAVQEPTIKQCFNCIQRQGSVVYMPCGHGGMCTECATLWFEQNKECPICRSLIKAILQIVQIDEQTVKVVGIIAQN
ncbi:unnamed protein product [Paramecium primaurelia]|uniref:RING-type domain-containing protein n=1 Tax=Paramecium primaurelia TaxID=5886 RepID=A0A8S1QGL0_PARPR|nr:unnamed protein product [Paramecium primaurelia]